MKSEAMNMKVTWSSKGKQITVIWGEARRAGDNMEVEVHERVVHPMLGVSFGGCASVFLAGKL